VTSIERAQRDSAQRSGRHQRLASRVEARRIGCAQNVGVKFAESRAGTIPSADPHQIETAQHLPLPACGSSSALSGMHDTGAQARYNF
jgi:hypothetical protein